jgi:hypothetical protein
MYEIEDKFSQPLQAKSLDEVALAAQEDSRGTINDADMHNDNVCGF